MKNSYLLTILSLVAVIMLAFAAGCTGNEAKTSVATQVPTTSPSVMATPQEPVSTAAVPVTTSAPVSTGQKQTIRISGSTTVLPIVQKAADEYMASHPDADIQVSGGGSGVGIQAIGAKTVDIGMSPCMTAAEKAKYPAFVVTSIAQDGIASLRTRQMDRFITSSRSGHHWVKLQMDTDQWGMSPTPTTRSSLSAVIAHPVPVDISMNQSC
jgi:phosphate transport system substrate-binding protein